MLFRSLETGAIDAPAAARAKEEALELHPSAAGKLAPWAVDGAVDIVEGKVGDGAVARDALEVQTAIVPGLQRAAERAVAEGTAELIAAHPDLAGVQTALVAVRAKDGAIVALVGGRDYATSLWDRATEGRREIGSTVKPLTLLVALQADPTLSPATRVDDAPIERTHDGKRWVPSNYDGQFVGPISLRRAIATSRNIPAVLLAERVGMGPLRDRLRGLGLSSATDYPSAALGGFGATPVELAGAYAVFSGGAYHRPWLVRAAADGSGDLRYDDVPEKADVRYSDRATFLAGDVLREVLRSGTGKSAGKYGVGPGAMGKSGTTDDYKDAWFAGVTGPYAVVVWVGYDKGKAVGLTGGQAALPTWARFVAATGTSNTLPAVPAGIAMLLAFVATTPVMLPPLARAIASFIPPRWRIEGALALEQILRQPIRTALTTGVLVVAVSNGIGLGHAIRDNVDNVLGWYGRMMRADWLLTHAGMISAAAAADGPETKTAEEEVRALPGLRSVEGIGIATGRVGGKACVVVARDIAPEKPLPLEPVGATEREVREALARGDAVAGTVLAQRTGLAAGDEIAVEVFGRTTKVRIAALVVDYTSGGASIHLARDTAKKLFGMNVADILLVSAEPGRAAAVKEPLAAIADEHSMGLK